MSIWILNQIRKFIKALASDASPSQLAQGGALGVFIGLIPFVWILSVPLILLLFVFNINAAMGFCLLFLTKLIVIVTDPFADMIGTFLLVKVGFLKPLWTLFYNSPIIPFTRFNNTVVLGNIVIGIVLYIPIYFKLKALVILYRKKLHTRVENLKIVKILRASRPVTFLVRLLID